MYTLKFQFVPRIAYLQSGVAWSPELLGLSELEWASETQILRTIVAREIASIFGVGSPFLRGELATASKDVVGLLGEDERVFFHSLRTAWGLLLNWEQMRRANEIIRSFRGSLPSLDELLEYSPVK
jgi:hypothetical protein